MVASGGEALTACWPSCSQQSPLFLSKVVDDNCISTAPLGLPPLCSLCTVLIKELKQPSGTVRVEALGIAIYSAALLSSRELSPACCSSDLRAHCRCGWVQQPGCHPPRGVSCVLWGMESPGQRHGQGWWCLLGSCCERLASVCRSAQEQMLLFHFPGGL